MKIIKFVVLIFIFIIAINPLRLYYESQEPSPYKQEMFFIEAEKSLDMKNFKEIRRTFFRQKTYTVTYEYTEGVSGFDGLKEMLIYKFKKNNWRFYKEYKSVRRDNKDGILLEFHKDNYIAEVELFPTVIAIRFWYKGYYE